MQSRAVQPAVGLELSNGCQPFGPVSTNYSPISGVGSGPELRQPQAAECWLLLTHPDLANITFLSAPAAPCGRQHR